MYHPEILCKIKNNEQPYPIQIHLMPDNRCLHNCNTCSYRIPKNKNNQLFDSKSFIPKEKMLSLLKDFKEIGVKAIENTGGGESLLYPYKEIMYEKIIEYGFDYALVTNGTLLTEDLSKLIAPKMSWARISIDAGNEKTYSRTRNAPKSDFKIALNAISLLRKYAKNPQFKLGVGFVINNENYNEIYKACKIFKDMGADNVRISAVFHPQGIDYFNQKSINKGIHLSSLAEELNDESFTVYNLFNERILNLKHRIQDYEFCGTKEVLCVIGGDCNVYLCCSLAFNKRGLIGSIQNQSFKSLWDSKEKQKMFRDFNAKEKCKCFCLYEKRNKFFNELLFNKPYHINFI